MIWVDQHREMARNFIATVQPNNPAILVANIESFMPDRWRLAFEKLFASAQPTATNSVTNESVTNSRGGT